MLLVIQSFGAKIAVKDGLFEVSTVENQTYIKREYAVSELSSIWVQHGCSLTNAAIVLAMDNDIDFLLLNHFGVPVGRFMPIRPNSIVSIQRAQLEAAQTADGFEFVKSWIAQKMHNQMDLLQRRSQHHNSKAKHNALIIKSITQINQQYENLLALQADSIRVIAEQLRGMEGTAGRAYFAGLSELLPDKYPFEKRSYQNPTDAFNSCLNYGYAILYNKVESALIKAGLNPYAGFLHRDDFQFKSMVYDFVEPYRTWVEDPIMSVFLHRALNNSHLQQGEDDKTLLSASGRKLIADAIIGFLQEKVVYQNTQQEVTRERLLLFKAQNLATQLMEHNQSVTRSIIPILEIKMAA
jgi:CRISP-associated protein Cas1